MRSQNFRSAVLLMTLMTFVASAAVLGMQAVQQEPESQPWIHVEVSGERANMNLNLPLTVIEAALALAPDAIVQDGQLQLGDEHEIPVAAIRDLWRELRIAGDAEFATIQHEGQDVRIALEGDTILVNVNAQDADADEQVQVEVPVPVVDALLSGEGETLNVRAAIQELSTLRGEMVRVIESDNNIRIWIDENPAQ